MATVSVKNIHKPSPVWLNKLARVINVGIIPVAVTTLKGLWEGDDAMLNKILLVITVTLPGLLEVIKLLMAEESEENPEK